MPNKIQIKRTSITGRTPNTTSSGNSSFIDTGELALNITDGKLFSSDGTNYIEVGANLQSINVASGFTANSTLVNATALNVVNRTNTATLYVTTSANVGTALTVNSTAINAAVNTSIRAIIANGSIGTSGQVLTSNATGIYWSTVSSSSTNPGGSDTQVQFNDGGSTFGATAGFTFNKNTNNVTISNTVTIGTTATVNGSLANLQALNVVNQTNTSTLHVTTSANVGSALVVNSTSANATVVFNSSSTTTSGNNVSGAILVSGGIGVGDSVYVKNRIGFANASNIGVVYQVFNPTANSLDTVFGQ